MRERHVDELNKLGWEKEAWMSWANRDEIKKLGWVG